MSGLGPVKALVLAALTTGATMIPASGGAQTLPAAALPQATAEIAPENDGAASYAPDASQAPDEVDAATADIAASPAEEAAMDRELECMAKVVYHESANQPREGQLAVAQTIMNRIASGRFADTPCKVANQPGQFFRTDAYDPPRDGPAWAMAVAVAREARAGTATDMAHGAMFFQTVSSTRPFRARTRVATIGAHAFYR